MDDLKPNTEYEFSVKVTKGRRVSTWSMSVLNSTFEDGKILKHGTYEMIRDFLLCPYKYIGKYPVILADAFI